MDTLGAIQFPPKVNHICPMDFFDLNNRQFLCSKDI